MMSEQIEIQNGQEPENEDMNNSVERCLTFESGGLVLFLSTKDVIEIINAYAITPLPFVPSFIKGIINLRGQILQVMDINFQDVRPIPVKRQQKLLDGMVNIEDGGVLMSFDCHALANYQY